LSEQKKFKKSIAINDETTTSNYVASSVNTPSGLIWIRLAASHCTSTSTLQSETYWSRTRRWNVRNFRIL